jgi:hypothetical protein
MFTIHTVSGKLSWTQLLNWAFLVLWVINYLANAAGFLAYQPPDDVYTIMPAIIALINILLRKYHTTEPLR